MKIVYTYGVFDLLHVGHIQVLEEAKALGDQLVVGVFTDIVAEGFKRKPIIPEYQRLAMVRSLSMVDAALYQEELSPFINATACDAAIIAKGPGANWESLIPKLDMFETVLLPYHDGVSTSAIIKQIQNDHSI